MIVTLPTYVRCYSYTMICWRNILMALVPEDVTIVFPLLHSTSRSIQVSTNQDRIISWFAASAPGYIVYYDVSVFRNTQHFDSHVRSNPPTKSLSYPMP
jgi:hypothetical protein